MGVKSPDVGVYPDATSDQYHSWPCANASRLKLFRKSAYHAHFDMQHPQDQTAAMRVGAAFHAAVLERETWGGEFSIAPKCDRRTNAGKAEWAEFESEAAGRTILTAAEGELVRNLADAAWSHPLSRSLLSGRGRQELSIVWDDEESKMRCKARIDRLTEQFGVGLVIDLKSCTDASPRGFARDVANFGYDLQAAHYLDGLQAVAPTEIPRRFVFIAVEKTPPFGVGVYELDDDDLRAAAGQRRAYLLEWKRCEESGQWPGYNDCTGILPISMPAWAKVRNPYELEDEF